MNDPEPRTYPRMRGFLPAGARVGVGEVARILFGTVEGTVDNADRALREAVDVDPVRAGTPRYRAELLTFCLFPLELIVPNLFEGHSGSIADRLRADHRDAVLALDLPGDEEQRVRESLEGRFAEYRTLIGFGGRTGLAALGLVAFGHVAGEPPPRAFGGGDPAARSAPGGTPAGLTGAMALGTYYPQLLEQYGELAVYLDERFDPGA